jgi:hypothetical protein
VNQRAQIALSVSISLDASLRNRCLSCSNDDSFSPEGIWMVPSTICCFSRCSGVASRADAGHPVARASADGPRVERRAAGY